MAEPRPTAGTPGAEPRWAATAGGSTSAERTASVPGKSASGSGGGADSSESRGGFLSELFAPVGGFGVTFATMFRKVATEEYPEEKRPTQPRYHGRHQLNRHPDGLEKCIGCELCAWACPADAIYVEGADNTEDGRFSPGERYGRVYQINYLRCIFCGFCIEACPTRALTMTNVYELADDDRGKLIFEKKQLLAPLQEGMLSPPHPMVEGMEERDYYQGKVASATPAQREWVEARDTAGAESSGSTDGTAGTDVGTDVSTVGGADVGASAAFTTPRAQGAGTGAHADAGADVVTPMAEGGVPR